jgi:SRSO17 transposase
MGVCFDYVCGDGYYGNSMALAESIEEMGCVYMFDIHSSLHIYLEASAVYVPSPKRKAVRQPVRVKPEKKSIRADRYMAGLEERDRRRVEVRNTTKGILKADYHFRTVCVFDEEHGRMLRRLPVIRRRRTKKGDCEYKYSFTNANPDQYAGKGIAYIRAQRFFVEHCIKENRQIPGMDKYRTRKWQAWQHQIALNFLLSTFILKEKLLCFDNIPLMSARDIKRWIIFKLYKQFLKMT